MLLSTSQFCPKAALGFLGKVNRPDSPPDVTGILLQLHPMGAWRDWKTGREVCASHAP